MGLNDEPMIKQKNYTAQQYQMKKQKSFSVAKRILLMERLSGIAGKNMFLSLGLFLVLCIATSAIPYFLPVEVGLSPESFPLRGGFFITSCCVFLVLFAIFVFWYAIAYKRLEIMCIHLDGALQGAREANEAVQRDNLQNSLEKISGLPSSNFSSLSGPVGVAEMYLQVHGIKYGNGKLCRLLDAILICTQIAVAVLCMYLSVS